MNIHAHSRYAETHARSIADPEGFWGEAAQEIDWIEPAQKVFDPSLGLYGRWFAGAVVNTCYTALDRHVAGGRADQVALIHDSPLANPVGESTITKYTYAEMLHEVQVLGAIMQDFGVAKGDRPRALADFSAALKIDPRHAAARANFKALALELEKIGADMGVKNLPDRGRPKPPLK